MVVEEVELPERLNPRIVLDHVEVALDQDDGEDQECGGTNTVGEPHLIAFGGWGGNGWGRKKGECGGDKWCRCRERGTEQASKAGRGSTGDDAMTVPG